MISKIRARVLLLLPTFMLLATAAFADEPAPLHSRIRIGVGTGYHANFMRFPGLSKEAYTYKDANHSGLFTLSVEYDFAKQFSIRPEFAWLSRGGKLDISKVGKIHDGLYTVKAAYFDLRVPVIYNFSIADWKLKPYAYIAPVFGFSRKGEISLYERQANGAEYYYKLPATRANMAGAYVAVAAGLGAKYPIEILGSTCYAGLELSYEFGLTDTYTNMERKNQTININNINGPVASARKFHGVEVKIAFQAPLTLFKTLGKKVGDKLGCMPVGSSTPAPRKTKKEGYTLKEIKQMTDSGKDVSGKTIYAINDVNFDTAKSTIKEESKKYLNELADFLIQTNLRVEIKGHTDNVGDDDFNMELSKERALAVKAYLESRGVPAKNITYSYYGETRPLDTNDTPEGRTRNRRVEFELLKK